MNQNLSFGYFMLFCLFACSSTKVIKLTHANGTSKEFGSRSFFTEIGDADSIQTSFANSIRMDSFVVGRFNYYPSSYSVYASRLPVYYDDPQDFQQQYKRIISDTTENIPDQDFSTEILFLLGKRPDGKYLVIADQNNNKNFRDDSIFLFNKINQNQIVSTTELDSFPHIEVKNVKSYYNKKVQTFSLPLIIEPILSFDPNSVESRNTLTLRVISVAYQTGTFKYKGNKYKVALRNNLLPYLYFDPKAIKIKFAPASDTTALQKLKGRQPTYYIGDTVNLDKNSFKIKEVSPFLNKLKIIKLRKAKE